jgi:anti-sigma factor RsiW
MLLPAKSVNTEQHDNKELSEQEHPNLEVLAAYVDNSVTRNERTRIEAHLAECTKCRETLVLVIECDYRDK